MSADVNHATGFLPSPASGRGAGGEGRRWHTDGPDFVDASSLTPAPSRKREREHAAAV
ncbi:hypothetical protein CBM2587_A10313 [Cupriavidus taiwanensis]|uniref:Uncharacterized protein n=1 Tax=Cupriavidus taiwanensis TaxID=164546 RepID=A0A975ZWN2_9BURK|nr:hypothetical protein CBM2587_A10313 [Cupriavidus taiwanensis]